MDVTGLAQCYCTSSSSSLLSMHLLSVETRESNRQPQAVDHSEVRAGKQRAINAGGAAL